MLTSAPSIVLLPGLDGTGDLFEDLIASLPRDFEMHAVRYPASEDLSYTALLPLVRASLPRDHPFILVAESFSVPLAILGAAENPPNLRGLILCAGFARSPLRGFVRSILRATAPMLFRMAPPRQMIRIMLVGCGAPRSLVSRVETAVLSVHPRILASRLNSVFDCDVRRELAKIAAPMLYLRALRDRIVAPSCGQEIVDLRPRCTLLELDGPHLLFQRNPVESANAIVQFIRGLET